MLYFWSSLAPQHRALTMFFANFNTSQLGCQHIEMVLRNIALLTETKHLSERKKRGEKNRMGCNSPECIHLMSLPLFFWQAG